MNARRDRARKRVPAGGGRVPPVPYGPCQARPTGPRGTPRRPTGGPTYRPGAAAVRHGSAAREARLDRRARAGRPGRRRPSRSPSRTTSPSPRAARSSSTMRRSRRATGPSLHALVGVEEPVVVGEQPGQQHLVHAGEPLHGRQRRLARDHLHRRRPSAPSSGTGSAAPSWARVAGRTSASSSACQPWWRLWRATSSFAAGSRIVGTQPPSVAKRRPRASRRRSTRRRGGVDAEHGRDGRCARRGRPNQIRTAWGRARGAPARSREPSSATQDGGEDHAPRRRGGVAPRRSPLT